jgi:hypothetical protein
LQEKPDTADYIVEGRGGVLANDGHEVTYGIPGSAALASASVLFSSPITAPTLPELSLGRRNHQAGTAKIGLFAYDRATREPVWQAGVKKAASEARDAWILGLGPYQSRPQSAAGRNLTMKSKAPSEQVTDPLNAYGSALVFEGAVRPPAAAPRPVPGVAQASHQQPATPDPLPLKNRETPAPKPLPSAK